MRTMKRAIGLLTIAAALFVACAPGAAQNAVGNFISLTLNGNRIVASGSGTATVTVPNTTQTLIGSSTLCTAANWCTATLTLTDAQIKALPTTYVTVVPGPGAGNRVKIYSASFTLNSLAGAYTNLDSSYAEFGIMGGTYVYGPVNDSSAVPAITDLNSWLGSAVRAAYDPTIPQISSNLIAGSWGYAITNHFEVYASVSGAAAEVYMFNASGNLTGGNAANTMKVRVYYAIEPL